MQLKPNGWKVILVSSRYQPVCSSRVIVIANNIVGSEVWPYYSNLLIEWIKYEFVVSVSHGYNAKQLTYMQITCIIEV